MSAVWLAVVAIAVAAVVVFLWVGMKMLASRPALGAPAGALPDPPAEPPRIVDVASPYKLVRARHGWMLVNANDLYMGQAVIRYGECCEIEVAFLLKLIALRPGAVIEVGTNIGTHTVPMAKLLATQNRRLIAFEPQPVIFQNLCANLALNGLGNVTAWPNACSDRSGTVYFQRPDYVANGNFGGVSMSTESAQGDIAVPCVDLDTFLSKEPVGLMKIDVEGFELNVLQGAARLIEQSRPVLYVENDRIDRAKDLIEWLWSKQYRLWWHVPPLFNPHNYFADAVDLYPRVASVNMLCLPREMELPFAGMEEVLTTRHPLEGRT